MSMSRWVRILVSVGLLALVIGLADWRAVGSVLKRVDGTWVAVALALAAADRVVLSYRWQVLLAARGVFAGFVRLLWVQLAANFLGSFLPSSLGVDAVRIAALCRAGYPAAQVIAATLVDRATIVIATLVFGSSTLIVLAQTLIPQNVARLVIVSTLVAVIAFAACLHPSVRRWVRSKMLPRIPERLRRTVSSIAEAALAYRRDRGSSVQVVIITAVMFAVRLVFAKAVCLACGVDLPFESLLLVIPILWIVVMLPITIGNLGVQDAGYVVLMSLVGVSPAIAVSMSLVEHVVTRVASLPGAFFIGEVTSKAARKQDPAPPDPDRA